jgi:hypothetical protein
MSTLFYHVTARLHDHDQLNLISWSSEIHVLSWDAAINYTAPFENE